MSSNISDRKQNLSDAKRALLDARLKGKRDSKNGIAQPAAPPPSIPPRADQSPAPASFAQERLWYLHQLDPHAHAYNMHGSVRLRGALDIDKLAHSLNALIARHAVLRTTFALTDDRLVQIVAPELRIDLSVVDLHDLPTDQREARATELASADGSAPFDLVSGPLLRATLLRMDQHDHILLLTIHHIATDEWSMGTFWREMAAFYGASSSSAELGRSLPDLPIQYTDFADWQRTRLQNGALDGQKAYWHKQLAGDLPQLQLPTDFPRPATQSTRGKLASIALPLGLRDDLGKLSQQHGGTLFMTMLAAFNALLFRYTNQTDLLIGTPIAQRDRAELQSLIGFCLNTVALRTQVNANSTFLDLMQQVRNSTLDAYAHQEYPFEKLVEELAPTRDRSINPLFQVMFVLQSGQVDPHVLPNLTLEPYRFDAGVAKFDLTLFVNEFGDSPTIAIEYNSDLFAADRIDRMLHHYARLLHAIVITPDERISHLPLLVEAEQEQIVHTWNDTAKAYPRDLCIHTMIERIAEKHPDSIAVTFGDEALSYRELNERANELAQRLVEEGIGPDRFVGLYMERSIEMIVAILGVLKAGGAYLPLDPAYPAARIELMLEETKAQVVVTQSEFRDACEKLFYRDTSTKLSARDAKARRNAKVKILEVGEGGGIPFLERNPAPTPDNLAYVIYTSGSTGKPKGVPISHQNLVHSTTARFDYYGDPVGAFLLLSSFSFDSSIVGIFWTLSQGGTLVLPQPGDETEVQKVAELIQQHGVTHTLGLPSLYRLLLQYAPPTTLDSLTTVMVAGESCPPILVDEHFARLPNTRLYNEYGPTEASVWCSAHQLQPPRQPHPAAIGVGTDWPDPSTDLTGDRTTDILSVAPTNEIPFESAGDRTTDILSVPPTNEIPFESAGDRTTDILSVTPTNEIPFESANTGRVTNGHDSARGLVSASAGQDVRGPSQDVRIPIGRPIANTRLYILDPHLQVLPVGIAGELFVGGEGVARGYLDRPLLSKEKFVNNPFVHGERLYRTGDLARYRADGEIEFLGRVDQQVKVRGVRIELGEIEAALVDHAEVAACAVVAHERNGATELVAYVVGDAQTATLRTYLASRLPEQMIPAQFVWLEALPQTPNGKVDRAALPAPSAVEQVETSSALPESELEIQLAKIWETVLNVRPVGIDDDYFALGGHSLQAVHLVQQIRTRLARDLPIATLLQAPTVRQQAALLEADGWQPNWSSLVAMQPHGTKTPFFCMHAVGGNVLSLRTLSQLLPDRPFYALQSQGLDGKNAIPTRVEEMAAYYIEEMRSVQPRGPYLIGGQSSGGLIAFEAARQLVAAGERVATLAMIDTYAPISIESNGSAQKPTMSKQSVPLAKRMSFHVHNLARGGAGYVWESGRTRAVKMAIGARRKVENALVAGLKDRYLGSGRPLPPRLRPIYVRTSIEQAVAAYRPTVYDGPITLFRATESIDAYLEGVFGSQQGWDLLTSQTVEVYDVEGGHNLEQEPAVGLLAEKLAAALDGVDYENVS